MGAVIKCDNAAKFLREALPQLKIASNDKSSSVRWNSNSLIYCRKQVYEICVAFLNKFDIMDLKQYESDLILILINGISDEQEHISLMCESQIEEYGTNLKVRGCHF